MIAFFALEFLMGEFGGANWDLLWPKGTGDFVGLMEKTGLVFPNLLALADIFSIRFIRKVGTSNRSIIRSNWNII